MSKLLFTLLLCLIFVCVFDPADQFFKLKVPLFSLCWFVLIVQYVTNDRQVQLPYGMLNYVLIFILIPIASIAIYLITDGRNHYDGFAYLKSYLFITLAILLYLANIDLLQPLCTILTLLSLVIISIFIITVNNPLLVTPIFEIGDRYGSFSLGERQYGGLVFKTIFFKTSPMIAIAIAYYSYKALAAPRSDRILPAALALINIFAMFLAGTRNNIIFAILIPFSIIAWYTRYKKLVLSLFWATFLLIGIIYVDVIIDMLSPKDVSNEIKIAYLSDYMNIFADTKNLLFGQGIGSYNYWTVLQEDTTVTELTYLEILRNYGLLLGAIVFCLVLYPLHYLRNVKMKSHHYVLIGYFCYLLMSASNPFLFSSSGMLILAIIMAHFAKLNIVEAVQP